MAMEALGPWGHWNLQESLQGWIKLMTCTCATAFILYKCRDDTAWHALIRCHRQCHTITAHVFKTPVWEAADDCTQELTLLPYHHRLKIQAITKGCLNYTI